MLLTIKICGEIKIHSVNFFATSVSDPPLLFAPQTRPHTPREVDRHVTVQRVNTRIFLLLLLPSCIVVVINIILIIISSTTVLFQTTKVMFSLLPGSIFSNWAGSDVLANIHADELSPNYPTRPLMDHQTTTTRSV